MITDSVDRIMSLKDCLLQIIIIAVLNVRDL